MYSNTTIDGPCRGDPHGTDVDMAVIKVKEGWGGPKYDYILVYSFDYIMIWVDSVIIIWPLFKHANTT